MAAQEILDLFVQVQILTGQLVNKKKQLVHVSDHEIEEILDQVPVNAIRLGNVQIKGDSFRLRAFKQNGIQCHLCGLKATRFSLNYHEKNNGYVLILYGMDSWTPEPVEFTVDHIIPRAKRGSGDLDNTRTMCAPCNQVLGRLMTIRKEIRGRRRAKKMRLQTKTIRPFKQG